MTEEIITALQAELFWALQLKTLLDQALITVTDPFEKDRLLELYQATALRWEGLRTEIELFQPTP